MKKMKVFLVGILTLVLSLFCLVGCFKTGKYEVVSYTGAISGSQSVPKDDESYVELKSDNIVKVYLSSDVLPIGSIDEVGTWTEMEDGTIKIEAGIFITTVTIDGGTMTFEYSGRTYTCKK